MPTAVARPNHDGMVPAACHVRQILPDVLNAIKRFCDDALHRVGVVIATRKQDRLVAVGQVRPADFREGQTVTFIDAQQRVLTTGTVVRVLADSVHVAYDRPVHSGREPGVGDMMVALPFGASTL